MIMGRYLHGCSSFTFDDELILAVVGGVIVDYNVTVNFNEFLSYNSTSPKWDNRGTELDLPASDEETASILVSNGETLYYVDTNHNIFFRLEFTFEGGFEWIQMNLKLKTPRFFAIGVLIPDELTNCTKTAIEIIDSD